MNLTPNQPEKRPDPSGNLQPKANPPEGWSPGQKREKEEGHEGKDQPLPLPPKRQLRVGSLKDWLRERRVAVSKYSGIAVTALLMIAGGMMIGQWDGPPSHVDRSIRDAAAVMGDEVVVDLVDGITAGQIEDMSREYGIELTPVSEAASSGAMIRVVNTSGREASAELIERLKADPRVESASIGVVYQIFSRPNDPLFDSQWNLEMIGMETAWEYCEGEGAIVAVLDTGSMLQGGAGSIKLDDFDTTSVQQGYDFIEDDTVPQDDQGHGSHVAGTVAQATNNGRGVAGVAPKATLLPVRVLGSNGRGGDAKIAEGIRWAVDQGANILNLSLGSANYSAVIESAVDYAHGKGVMVICAAGNTADAVSFPAALPNAFAVSAVGDDGLITSYSCRGPEVDLAAPGGAEKNPLRWITDAFKGLINPANPPDDTKIIQQTVAMRGNSPVATYQGFAGTSMACPHVAGVAALVWSMGVKDPAEIRSALQRTAQPKQNPDYYGAGVLDASAAVRFVGRLHGMGDLHRVLGGLGILFGLMRGLGKGDAPSWMTRNWQLFVAVGTGLFFPEVVLSLAGSASKLNLLGHSALIPLFLDRAIGDSADLKRKVGWFGLGVALNLVLDVLSTAAPFAVLSTSVIRFWMVANVLAIGWVFGKLWLSREGGAGTSPATALAGTQPLSGPVGPVSPVTRPFVP